MAIIPKSVGSKWKNSANIINAIKSNKKTIIDSGLNVYVMCFNSNIFEHVFPLLESTCKETGGSEINIK